ncbi:hypothetical protein MNEG_4406 [Monoraphidium neglectum]|uniref:Uncharacterized protein n=1 Tax=Monoraphidium neglectum TaxID=145388 RepID=A0A0D2JY86_9CHLO|nr:hypothetical protein MNEG_4406 [Monoraphidium neglectum]KIZ03553.1 hypothetical protein MNEG_4406 [Monoraphidium neglectum]|eukprot:XP_013902572.1 hypothetical protein MNEG_4406 [Monoraphidium neglectum]
MVGACDASNLGSASLHGWCHDGPHGPQPPLPAPAAANHALTAPAAGEAARPDGPTAAVSERGADGAEKNAAGGGEALAALLGDFEGSRLVDLDGIAEVLGGDSRPGAPAEGGDSRHKRERRVKAEAAPHHQQQQAIGAQLPSAGGGGASSGCVDLRGLLQQARDSVEAPWRVTQQQPQVPLPQPAAPQQPQPQPQQPASAAPAVPPAALKQQEEFLISLLMQQQALQRQAARQTASGLTPALAGLQVQQGPGGSGGDARPKKRRHRRTRGVAHGAGQAGGADCGSAAAALMATPASVAHCAGVGVAPMSTSATGDVASAALFATPAAMVFPVLRGQQLPSPPPWQLEALAPATSPSDAAADGGPHSHKRAAAFCGAGAAGGTQAGGGSAQKRRRWQDGGEVYEDDEPMLCTDENDEDCRCWGGDGDDDGPDSAPAARRSARIAAGKGPGPRGRGVWTGAAARPGLAVASIGLLPPETMARRILSDAFPAGPFTRGDLERLGWQPATAGCGSAAAGAAADQEDTGCGGGGGGGDVGNGCTPPGTPPGGLRLTGPSVEALLAGDAPSPFVTPGKLFGPLEPGRGEVASLVPAAECDTLLGPAGFSPSSMLGGSRFESLLASLPAASQQTGAAAPTAQQQAGGAGDGVRAADQPTDFRRLYDLLARDGTNSNPGQEGPPAAAPTLMPPPADRPLAAAVPGLASRQGPQLEGVQPCNHRNPHQQQQQQGAGEFSSLVNLDIGDAAVAIEAAGGEDADVSFLLGGIHSRSWLLSPAKGAPAAAGAAAAAAAAAAGLGGGAGAGLGAMRVPSGGFDASRPFAALFGGR